MNVAGVQQLSLDVIGSTNNTAGDFAIWADPRLISTANFGQYQVSPYTMTWQVSENGQILSTQTTDSFLFPYVQAGVYTISLTVTDAERRYRFGQHRCDGEFSRRLGHADQPGHQDAGQLDRSLRQSGP